MQQNINEDQNFWNKDNKEALQKNLNNVFEAKDFLSRKIITECLAIQGLAIMGALAVCTFMNDSSVLNKKLVFTAACLSSMLAVLRAQRKKEVLKETLAAIGIFSFFGEKATQVSDIQKKLDVIKKAEPILKPNYSNVYKQTKRAVLLSSIALTTGYLLDKVHLGPALLAGVSILAVCNTYDLMLAKQSIKRISKALPKGIYLPIQKNNHTRA